MSFLHIAYGGGVNSTAMLCFLREKGLKPSLITFADTGAEMPHTLIHVSAMDAAAQSWWGVPITTVRKLYQGKIEGVAGQCERQNMMPSIAYGLRSCSMKYKHEPQDRALKAAMRAAGATLATRAIGYDAGEGHRVKAEHLKLQQITKKLSVQNWYPLVEAGWGRNECIEAIRRHGLEVPRKSSCYICAAMKKREVFQLRKDYPELLERALRIEANAAKTTTTDRGLGGERNHWANWIANEDAQGKLGLDIEPVHVPCGCYDGGSEEVQP